jgi:uncharacterized phage protein (TIGR01671 family)
MSKIHEAIDLLVEAIEVADSPERETMAEVLSLLEAEEKAEQPEPTEGPTGTRVDEGKIRMRHVPGCNWFVGECTCGADALNEQTNRMAAGELIKALEPFADEIEISMQDYIFRGLTIAEKKWAYGSLIQSKDKKKAYIGYAAVLIHYYDEVYPASVGLWTGKKDIAKKDIYARDIVRAQIYRDEQAMILEVKWLDGAFVFDYPGDGFDYQNIGNFPGSLEVVGNLTENPELLEAKPCKRNHVPL